MIPAINMLSQTLALQQFKVHFHGLFKRSIISPGNTTGDYHDLFAEDIATPICTAAPGVRAR